MRYILTSILLVVLLFPALVLGETIKAKDLVKRDGRYYKKFTAAPFTGKVTGGIKGAFKEGKQDGPWVTYHISGQ